MYKILLVLFLSSVVFAELIDGVAVTVKGSPITLHEIKEQMESANISADQAKDILVRKKLEELEIKERKIDVSSSEVYDDIKQTAERNNMSVSQFYEVVRNRNGLTSAQLKDKIKEKLMSQKLYGAIAYSSVSKPSEQEIKEYYELHKSEFVHPGAFDVVIYMSASPDRLKEKIDNPMFYAPDIQTNEQHIEYEKVAPELASLLSNTSVNTFSQIVPNGQGGYMSFYIKAKEDVKEAGIESVKNQIISTIMGSKREMVLGEFFERMKLSANIKVLRMPE
ncbi:peptidylprolyl isomerase [Sulfurimonas sp.]|uniref:peptidylprolyl isomerase n=1 Tax=Sulfurimonas sp. TaxID=2022749 RepID=UPI003561AB78